MLTLAGHKLSTQSPPQKAVIELRHAANNSNHPTLYRVCSQQRYRCAHSESWIAHMTLGHESKHTRKYPKTNLTPTTWKAAALFVAKATPGGGRK